MSQKYVYTFGAGKADGKADMKLLLGGKGANLAEMSNLGIPVPAGFTISTEICTEYYANSGKYNEEVKKQVKAGVESIEKSITCLGTFRCACFYARYDGYGSEPGFE
jgi:pyruvate,orthophosphate dikinase